MTDIFQYLPTLIPQLEKEGKVTRTFRRLDPERQQAVVQAILSEAAEKGPSSLNIKDVAQRAGVAVGSLYQYFPDRDGLLDFAVTLFTTYMLGVFREARPYLMEMPLQQALEAYVSTGVEWGQTEADLMRFFGRAAYQGDSIPGERAVRPVGEAMREVVVDMLRGAQYRGELRPDIDLEATARVVNALMIAIGDSQLFPYLNNYFQVTDGAEMSAARVTSAAVALVMQGIAAASLEENQETAGS